MLFKRTNKFFSDLSYLERELNKDITPKQIYDDCVSKRLSDVLKIQGEFLDENLKTLEHSINIDFHNPNDIKYLCSVLKCLYNRIAIDRLHLLDNLIELTKVEE